MRQLNACSDGYARINDLPICYEDPGPGYELNEEGVAWSICPNTLPHECGTGLCTTDTQECTETLSDMATSSAEFFIDLSA